MYVQHLEQVLPGGEHGFMYIVLDGAGDPLGKLGFVHICMWHVGTDLACLLLSASV